MQVISLGPSPTPAIRSTPWAPGAEASKWWNITSLWVTVTLMKCGQSPGGVSWLKWCEWLHHPTQQYQHQNPQQSHPEGKEEEGKEEEKEEEVHTGEGKKKNFYLLWVHIEYLGSSSAGHIHKTTSINFPGVLWKNKIHSYTQHSWVNLVSVFDNLLLLFPTQQTFCLQPLYKQTTHTVSS